MLYLNSIMESYLTPEELTNRVREEIKKKFKRLVEDARRQSG